MLTDLADICRTSGLKVVEHPGWKTRGHGDLDRADIRTIVVHHTATPNSLEGDYPTMATVRDGRTGLPGPLSQLGLGRSGTVYVIAAGVSYHAGKTHSTDQNNWHAIGIEAEHPGGSTPWPPGQYSAYVRLCAALAKGYGLDVSRVQGHKEVAEPTGRKSDPNFEMAQFRVRVLLALGTNEGDDMQWSDKVPNQDYSLGTGVVRGEKAYDWVKEGGEFELRVQRLSDENAQLRRDVDRLIQLVGDGS